MKDKIALAQEFRDTLLQRYPYHLDQFLQQSTEGSEAEVSEYPIIPLASLCLEITLGGMVL